MKTEKFQAAFESLRTYECTCWFRDAKIWKAVKFDPYTLMDKYYKTEARYFVGQVMHHDHFFNYLSRKISQCGQLIPSGRIHQVLNPVS